MKNIILLKYERVLPEAAFAIYAVDAVKMNDDEPGSYDVHLVALEPNLSAGWRHKGSMLLDSRQLESDLPVKVEDLEEGVSTSLAADRVVARRVSDLLARDAAAKKAVVFEASAVTE